MKKTLMNLLGISNYEDDFVKLSENHNDLCKEYEKLKTFAEEQSRYVEHIEAKVEQLESDPNAYWTEKMQRLVDEFEKKMSEIESLYEDEIKTKEMMLKDIADENARLKRENEVAEHRGISIGRNDAYSQMGIWRLEAMKQGNVLVMDKEGNVFELLQGLEDVKPDETSEDDSDLDDALEDFDKIIEEMEGEIA